MFGLHFLRVTPKFAAMLLVYFCIISCVHVAYYYAGGGMSLAFDLCSVTLRSSIVCASVAIS